MGLTERHWFENEDVPENYEWALEDAVYNSRTNKKVEPKGTCTSCMHYNPFAGICSNTLSDYRGQYMPPTEVCDEYTEQEDEYAD